MHHFFALLNSTTILKTLGLAGVLAIIFAESGLLIGFFLPGDSLLFTAGFLASQGLVNFWLLFFGSMVAAVIGDNVGYTFGKKIGPKIFTKDHSFFFNKKYIEKSTFFFQKHGQRSLILARFVPAVRTFTPILAGVGNMDYRSFLTYNAIGAILWAGGMSLLGFFLGNVIPNIDHYIYPIVIAIIIVSILPAVFSFLRRNKNLG
jgi:membrane-associated protein